MPGAGMEVYKSTAEVRVAPLVSACCSCCTAPALDIGPTPHGQVPLPSHHQAMAGSYGPLPHCGQSSATILPLGLPIEWG